MNPEIERVLEDKNRLCTEFAQEWVSYFDENFPWDNLNGEDAYATLIHSMGYLLARYGGDDPTEALIRLDVIMDKTKDFLVSEMKRQLYPQ